MWGPGAETNMRSAHRPQYTSPLNQNSVLPMRSSGLSGRFTRRKTSLRRSSRCAKPRCSKRVVSKARTIIGLYPVDTALTIAYNRPRTDISSHNMPELFPDSVWQKIAAYMEGPSGTFHIAETALPPTRPQLLSLRLTTTSIGVGVPALHADACLDVIWLALH
jgi:hypothetical protein